MDWMRILVRGGIAFSGAAATAILAATADGNAPNMIGWIAAIANSVIAAGATVEALIATSASPAGRKQERSRSRAK